MQQSALRHHSFGKPLEVLQLEQIAQPEPQAGEVRVRLEAAAINPSDYGMIGGSYGRLRELPAVPGSTPETPSPSASTTPTPSRPATAGSSRRRP